MEPTRSRPMSPHATIYKPPVAMLASITHRLTALFISIVGPVLLIWFLVSAASGPEAYQYFISFTSSWFGTLVLFSLTWCVAQHFASGLRHLFMDAGYGFNLQTSTKTAKLTYVFSTLVTVILWTVTIFKDWI